MIPLISEINRDEIVDSCWYKVYPTTIHRDNDSPWFFPGRDLRTHIEISTKAKHELDMALMWGKL
jgi:hypothetical protein